MERALNFFQTCPSTDIVMNRWNELFIDHEGALRPHEDLLFESELDYRNFFLDQLSRAGKTWDAKNPYVDGVLWGTHRIHAIFPPISGDHLVVSLRRLPVHTPQKKPDVSATEERWKDSQILWKTVLDLVHQRKNVLIAGATGSGKTTLLNDLLGRCDLQDRIIALEDTRELALPHPHVVYLSSRPANADGMGRVTLKDLVRQTLRMRPDRIILGEIRGDEVIDLLQLLNTGHQGTWCTLHANSPRDALRRLELLALIGAKGQIPGTFIKELIVSSVDAVVYMERSLDAKAPEKKQRRIHSVGMIEGKEGDVIRLRLLPEKGLRSIS